MSLDIHFLNVGHGDCTIIDFEERRLSMIDINNSKSFDVDTDREIRDLASSEARKAWLNALFRQDNRFTLAQYEAAFLQQYSALLTDPVDFLNAQFPSRSIFRFILTHPDMDHMSGLYRLREQGIKIANFWDTRNSKVQTAADFESNGQYDKRDWDEYQRIKSDQDITKIYLRRGEDRLQFWKDDSIWIGAPTAELETLADSTKDWNHVSYVLFVGYSDYWVVLGGDASERTWESIYAVWGDWMKRADVKILKASHHGRDTGYHQPSVAALEPEYTIISVGRLPDTDASNKYRQYSKVYTTRYHGNIKAQLWYDGDVWLHDAKGRRIN